MNPADALQYLSQIAADFARTLPPSAQGPTVHSVNVALGVLTPLVEARTNEPPRLAAVD